VIDSYERFDGQVISKPFTLIHGVMGVTKILREHLQHLQLGFGEYRFRKSEAALIHVHLVSLSGGA
jgi:hypothetical protein